MGRVGFIGLGIMGIPMAKNLMKSGYELVVNDIDLDAVKKLTDGGAQYGTPSEIGHLCDVVFTMLPNGTVVQEVLIGKNGVASSIRSGALVIDMSSVTPVEAQTSAETFAKLGVGYLDSPVSGGEPGAINATLTFMVGGDEQDFARAQPYFEAMGSSSTLIGPVGSGSVAKLANQVIVNLTIAVVSEAFALATKCGADPEKVYQAIRGGLAGSAVLDAKIPLILERNFAPGGAIYVNHKDIKNVLSTAQDHDVPMYLTSQLFVIMEYLKIHGHMHDDHGGIVQFFEDLAGLKVQKSS